MDGPGFTIETTDLTPIAEVGDVQDQWLRDIARLTDTGPLAIPLSRGLTDDHEPIVHFDAHSGKWWTGRYIGEVTYGHGTLRVLPRFGVPQLQRWLSRIWGARLVTAKGQYRSSRLWLWELLARLWEARLLSGAKHGLPARRIDVVHRGPTLRGRLDIRGTAKELRSGSGKLLSRSRERTVDRQITAIILCAFEQLKNQLHHLGNQRSWLNPRAQSIVQELQSHHGRRVGDAAAEMRNPVQYTPIMESYRPVVDLSVALLRKRPTSSSSAGQNDVFGVLIDMAEVWELYVFHLLHSNLANYEVTHTGRRAENESHLLHSVTTGNQLGGLRPDILLNNIASDRLHAVVDAKYKSTTPSSHRPSGVQREDLYQINAYASALGQGEFPFAAALVYPHAGASSAIFELQHASPWRASRHNSPIWFLSVDCLSDELTANGLTEGESEFIRAVRNMSRGPQESHVIDEMTVSSP
jgi:5-methylcytosine-specific restriction enzyme subunit McrC